MTALSQTATIENNGDSIIITPHNPSHLQRVLDVAVATKNNLGGEVFISISGEEIAASALADKGNIVSLPKHLLSGNELANHVIIRGDTNLITDFANTLNNAPDFGASWLR